MRLNKRISPFFVLGVSMVILLPVNSKSAHINASTAVPASVAAFENAIQNLHPIHTYTFGTNPQNTISSLSDLSASFTPYGIAGTTVINQEWERYQSVNAHNFVMTPSSLDLTATIPKGGGLFSGGIFSGQIWSRDLFQPGATGHDTYAFEVRMKIPKGQGMWPASWFYTLNGAGNDGSEIDNPEFFMMQWQNQFDWTGFQHGPGQGPQLYSIKTNQWVWHPGEDFSAEYHNYQTLWTQNAVYKYCDGVLVYAQQYKWTSKNPASFAVNLAVGSDVVGPGLKPTSLNEFPATLSVAHIMVWAD